MKKHQGKKTHEEKKVRPMGEKQYEKEEIFEEVQEETGKNYEIFSFPWIMEGSI